MGSHHITSILVSCVLQEKDRQRAAKRAKTEAKLKLSFGDDEEEEQEEEEEAAAGAKSGSEEDNAAAAQVGLWLSRPGCGGLKGASLC